MYTVGIEESDGNQLAAIFGCVSALLPFNYLGLKVGCSPRKCSTWESILRKCRDKLSNLKKRNLSMGGRIVLIKSVMSSLPLYYMCQSTRPQKRLLQV